MILTWFEEGLVPQSIARQDRHAAQQLLGERLGLPPGLAGLRRSRQSPRRATSDRRRPTSSTCCCPTSTTPGPSRLRVGIGAGSQNQEAAYEFIEWYTGPENQEAIFNAFGLYPSRPDVAQELNEAGAIEGYDIIVEQSDYINELPRQALWWGPFTDAVTEQITPGHPERHQRGRRRSTPGRRVERPQVGVRVVESLTGPHPSDDSAPVVSGVRTSRGHARSWRGSSRDR